MLRAKERIPHFATLAESAVYDLVRAEVTYALSTGSVCAHKPGWLSGPFEARRGRPHVRSQRFCWTPDRARCYLICPTRERIFVVTTLVPRPELAHVAGSAA